MKTRRESRQQNTMTMAQGKSAASTAPAKHQLVGERTGRRYRLADRVRVQLMRVDMETSKIDFRLADEGGGKREGERQSGAKRKVRRNG